MLSEKSLEELREKIVNKLILQVEKSRDNNDYVKSIIQNSSFVVKEFFIEYEKTKTN